MQVVRVDEDTPHFTIDQPVADGWVGTVAPVIVEGSPGDYVIVPFAVIELIEEQRPNTYDEAMELDPPAPHIRRRFFTEWEPVNGD